MDVQKTTKVEIDRRVKRLRDQYGDFTVHETTVENDREYFERGWKMASEGWIGDAGAWVTDDKNRVLLIRHEGSPDRWGTPGGGHEPGETMEETARREVREETGIECILTGVNFARRKTIVLETDPTERYTMLTVIFDAAYNGGCISVRDEEVLEATWFTEPPENILDFVRDNIATWKNDH